MTVFTRSGLTRRHALASIGGAASCIYAPELRAQEGPAFKDLVVLIPGIMGSVLKTRSGSTVWGMAPDVLLSILKAGNLDLRTLRDAAPADPVSATEIFPTTTLIPGFWGVDGYTEVREQLVSELKLSVGINYYEFPYDWRKDNRIAARQLQKNVTEWIGRWREISKDSNVSAVLVCHSMGGLVAQYACEVLGMWKDVRSIFTLGTPFQGAVKALNVAVNGLISEGLTATIRSFDSLYQLMPVYACVDPGNRDMRSISNAPVLHDRIDFARYCDVGLAFHEECRASASKALWDSSRSKKVLHTSNSYSHRTACSILVDGQQAKVQEFFREGPGGGDGTVPGYAYCKPLASSAGQRNTFFCNQLHGSIQIYKPAISNISSFILDQSFSSERGDRDVSLHVQETVKAGQNGTISVRLSVYPGQEIRVKIENVTTKQLHWSSKIPIAQQLDFEFRPRMSEQGIYRVVLDEQSGPLYCSDLMCVL